MWKMLVEDGKENVMGKIEGIKIKNYGPIREVRVRLSWGELFLIRNRNH